MPHWRWSCPVVLLAMLGTLWLPVAVLAAPPLPASTVSPITGGDRLKIKTFVQYECNRLAAVTNLRRAVRIRRALTAPVAASANASAEFRYRYAHTVGVQCAKLLTNKNAALNAIIVIADMRDISVETALENGLSNHNPAVRYWAAKGLGEILNTLSVIRAAFHRAIAKLGAALKAETDPIVRQRIEDTLVEPRNPPRQAASLLIGALATTAKGFAASPPHDLESVVSGITDVNKLLKKNVTLNAVQTRAAVSAVSRLISFSAQWYDTRQIPLDEKPFVPQVMAAAGVLLDRLGKTTDFSGLKTGPKPDPVSLLLKVNNVTGSPGAPGEIQKVFPGVKSPPRIKKTAVAVVPAAPRSKTRP